MLYDRLKETTHNLTYSGNKEQTEKRSTILFCRRLKIPNNSPHFDRSGHLRHVAQHLRKERILRSYSLQIKVTKKKAKKKKKIKATPCRILFLLRLKP